MPGTNSINMEYRPATTKVIEWVAFDGSTGLYPQAVIRYLSSDAIFATVNLDDAGGGRYRGSFTLPDDNDNEGFYMSETLIMYSDSGHNTPDPNYEISNVIYRVIANTGATPSFTNASNQRVDYKVLANIVEDITKSTLKVAVQEVLNAVEDVKEMMLEQKSFQGNFMTLLEQQISSSFAKMPIAQISKDVEDSLRNAEVAEKARHEKIVQVIDKSSKDIKSVMSDRLEIIVKENFIQSKGLAQLIRDFKTFSKVLDMTYDCVSDIKTAVTKIYSKFLRKVDPFYDPKD